MINLSSDKDHLLREAFRVLKPGGRFAVSDVVSEGALPEAVRKDMESYVGCVAGALDKGDYLAKLGRAGFVAAAIEPTRRYRFAELEDSTCSAAAVAALSPEGLCIRVQLRICSGLGLRKRRDMGGRPSGQGSWPPPHFAAARAPRHPWHA